MIAAYLPDNKGLQRTSQMLGLESYSEGWTPPRAYSQIWLGMAAGNIQRDGRRSAVRERRFGLEKASDWKKPALVLAHRKLYFARRLCKGFMENLGISNPPTELSSEMVPRPAQI